jgi:hypothetical protein
MSKRTEPRGRGSDVIARARVARVLQRDDIGELEVVFELYCELWELVGELPRRAAVLFVLDELAHSGVSEELAATLDELRALPFVESAAGPAGDRDSTWFGLQIMLNQLLLRGHSLLSAEHGERLRDVAACRDARLQAVRGPARPEVRGDRRQGRSRLERHPGPDRAREGTQVG